MNHAGPGRVVDPLKPVPERIYRDAEERYVDAVSPRAFAIYRVGHVTHPGISDLDLLIVPKAAWVDNARYFSVWERLPAELGSIFRHEPLVLPSDRVDAIRYTTHAAPQLIHGKDVIGSQPLDESRESLWSLLLEGYLHYARFVRRTPTEGEVAEGRLVMRASSLRFSLRILDRLVGTNHAASFEERLDRFRSGFFERDPSERDVEAWQMACDGTATLERELAAALPLAAEESLVQLAGNVLRRDGALPGLDPAALAERRATVRAYHKALEGLRFFQGGLFFSAAYRKRYRQARDSVQRFEAATPRSPGAGGSPS